MLNITICSPDKEIEKQYKEGISYYEIAQDVQSFYGQEIVLAFAGSGKLCELHLKPTDGEKIKFVTIEDEFGFEAYRRSMTFLLAKAVNEVEKKEKLTIHFSVDLGYYFSINGMESVPEAYLQTLEEKMRDLSARKIVLKKESYSTDDAIRLFGSLGMNEKEKLFSYRRSSRVNVYDLDGYKDYYYGYMVHDTGCLNKFRLFPYKEGFVMQMPPKKDMNSLPELKPQNKLFETQNLTEKWGQMLGLSSISDLNNMITSGNGTQMILLQEALMEKRIGDIATEIAGKKDVKFVLIAGPSSSGKTTFSHRLSVQLRVQGLTPHPIAVDNYFMNREETPKDENGDYDFECLEAVDVKLFNEQMQKLLAGELVSLPIFNFAKGCKEFGNNFLQIGENDVLVIEGIHCLNPKMTAGLADKNKYKIYISALTQLNIDNHNRIPSTDGRLLRRIIRDARTRGTSAKRTISMWHSVRRGEEKNIFPFQEEADAMFNSTLIYELAVLKPYVEAELFAIERDCPEYIEAKRLLKFLDYFVGLNAEDIPKNSLIREFVGGGCFNV